MKNRWTYSHILFNFLTDIFYKFSREFFVFWFFWIFLIVIIIKLFSFTVINHKYYETLAQKQQTLTTKSNISRWTIYSTNQNASVLATSVNLNDLAVDPSIPWNKTKLNSFLTDVVYNEICYLKSSRECRKNLSKFLWVLEILDFANNEKYLKSKIWEKISQKISRTKVTSVLVKDNLNKEEAFNIEKLALKWIYINGANLYVNPEEIINLEETALKISGITSILLEELKHHFRKRDLKYVLILNKLSISWSEYIKQKINEENSAYSRWFITRDDSISKYIILTANQHRLYTENDMLSSVLWYVDNDWEWRYWIEWYYNNILKWKETQTFSKKDITWKIIDPISLTNTQESFKWANITLTIDRNIQKKVEEIIDADIETYRANKISAIVMDPKTWEILAMATNPRYNPNSPSDVFELEKVTFMKYPNPPIDLLWFRVFTIDNVNWKEYYYDNKKILLREISREELWDNNLEKYVFVNKDWPGAYKNDIIQDLYEPGSIFKPITMAAWIDSWEINRFDMYKDEWSVNIDNFKISNVSKACIWYKTYQNAMNYSCNVWMISIARKIWASILHKYIEDFWFWKQTWISLEWEVYSKMSPYEKWSRAQLFTTSFWKWITLNMLQMATSYSVIANWWVYIKPQIIKSIEFSNWKKISNKPEITHRVIKESTSKIMIQVLVDGVVNWVAKWWAVKWYSIAWKTWTSQMVYKWRYENWTASTNWSFAWFWPAEDPKFVIIVRVDRPRSSIFWWETVSASFSKIAEYLFNYYKIPPKI